MISPLCRWLLVILLVLLSAHCFGDDPCQGEAPPPSTDAAVVAGYASMKASTGIVTGTVLRLGTTTAVAGALVTIRTQSATTAANGTFRITGLPSGSATIRITKTGYEPFSAGIWVFAGTLPMGKVRIVPLGKVTGVVTSEGLALGGVRVSCGGVARTTGADGVYTLSNVPLGKQTLRATKTGYASHQESVTITAGGTLTRNIDLGGPLPIGEGAGRISADDFDPFGVDGGPAFLWHWTIPATGTYQVILSAGPAQPALPNPWLMVLGGHVDETSQSFLAAYNNGAGVLAQNHGTNIAQVTVTASAGDEFTFVFSSWTGGLGNYQWRVTKL